jgi:hypothetical protein
MRELLPGLYHWQAFNDDISHEVDSYYVVLDQPVLIDPMVPKEGIDWFRQHGEPTHVFMTNRLHDRGCQECIDTYGATVWCHRAGLHEFEDGLHEFEDGGLQVTAFDHGDELPGGVRALEVAVLCPEETALLVPVTGGALSIGDALVRWEEKIGFVPDYLLGDDPLAIKIGIRDAFLRICDSYDFDHLLFAHGEPLVGGGKAELRRYLEGLEG